MTLNVFPIHSSFAVRDIRIKVNVLMQPFHAQAFPKLSDHFFISKCSISVRNCPCLSLSGLNFWPVLVRNRELSCVLLPVVKTFWQ